MNPGFNTALSVQRQQPWSSQIQVTDHDRLSCGAAARLEHNNAFVALGQSQVDSRSWLSYPGLPNRLASQEGLVIRVRCGKAAAVLSGLCRRVARSLSSAAMNPSIRLLQQLSVVYLSLRALKAPCSASQRGCVWGTGHCMQTVTGSCLICILLLCRGAWQ